jgi:glutamate 5-kinase
MENKRIIIKIGTQVIIDENSGDFALARINSIISDIVSLHQSGNEIVIVSSGAVGLGRKALSLFGTLEMEEKQACASIGQHLLMNKYFEQFAKKNITISQILVTADDFADQQRYLNLKNTYEKLLQLKVIPIINENDVVSIAGIKEDNSLMSFDDNDKLSALVAIKLAADYLIILTNVDGIFDKNPTEFKDAKLLRQIDKIEALDKIEVSGQSSLGRGGMTTKLNAAKLAALNDVTTLISSGYISNPILSALNRESGTEIKAQLK